MAQQQNSGWYLSREQIRAMSEAQLRDTLAKQQEWAQQRFPNDAYKAGQPEAKPQGNVSFTDVRDPLVVKLREFAGWSPEHLQKVHPNDLARLVHSNGQVIDAIVDFDSRNNTPAPARPAAPAAKEEQPELGKVDGAGGQMTPAMLEAVKKENERMEAAMKAEKENAAAAKKTDTAAAPGAMTPKDIAKTKADFAAESKAAETRLTQAGLHILGNNYQVDDGKPHGRGYDAVDGIDGPGTRAARENFVAGIQDRNSSVKLDSPADVDAQIRAELVARKDDPVFNQTLAEMRQSGTPQEKKIAGEIATFYQGNPPMPEGRQAVLGSGITRTVTGQYQQPAPVETAATPAAPAPGQESAFEEPAFGFNDRGPVLRPSQAAFPLAARGKPQTPDAPVAQPPAFAQDDSAPQPIELVSRQDVRQERPVNTAEDRRAANVVEALQRDPEDITRTNLGQILAQSYRNDIAGGKVSAGAPVLFEGDRKGRLFVAYGGQNGGTVTVKDITNFNDPGLGLNPLARDIASLAAEGRGGMVDNTTVPNAYAAAMDRARQWQEQREQQRQQQLAQQQEWAQRQQQSYSSAPPPSGWYGGGSRGYESVDRGPPPGWRGGNPGVSFHDRNRDRDMGPPPGWPGGGDSPGVSFWSQNHHGGHHHGHGGRSLNLDLGQVGQVLTGIFSGVSSGQQGPDLPPVQIGFNEDRHGHRSYGINLGNGPNLN